MKKDPCKLSSHIPSEDTLESIKNIEAGKNVFSVDSFEELLKLADIKSDKERN